MLTPKATTTTPPTEPPILVEPPGVGAGAGPSLGAGEIMVGLGLGLWALGDNAGAAGGVGRAGEGVAGLPLTAMTTTVSF